MGRLILSILLSLFTLGVVAQQVGTIRGKVHLADGTAVSHASVTVEGSQQGTVTDDKGRFELSNVPYGTRTLVVSSIEIDTEKKNVNVNRSNINIDISVSEASGEKIDEVAVVGKTVKQALEISGFAVTVIETKEAALRNLTTNELLDRAVGVRVRQNGGLGSRVEYNLNGLSGSAIGIFIDGIPISTFGQSFNLNNIPPAMIERIDVYKGVLPAHLAGNYVGGAIDVIMRKDASANNITAAVSYGSFNTYQADLSALYRNQKTGFTTRASGFYTYTDNSYDMWGKFAMITGPDLKLNRYQNVKRFNNTYKSIGGRFEAGFTDVKWADQFFLGYNVTDTYNEIPHGTTMARPYVGRFQEYQANVFSLNYVKRDLFLDGLALNINAVHSSRSTYLQDTARTLYNWDGNPMQVVRDGVLQPIVRPVGQAQQGTAMITNVDRNILNARTTLSYIVARGHRLSLSHNMDKTKREDEDLLNLNNVSNEGNKRSTSTDILGFNYEAQTFDGKLSTNLLAKYTVNRNHLEIPFMRTISGTPTRMVRDTTISYKNPGYGLTVSYNAISDFFIIASNEVTVISPREEQLYGSPENNLLENLDLKPERNVNYNLGFRHNLVKTEQSRLSLYASAFWRLGYDKINIQTLDSVIVGRENDANLDVTRYENIGKTQTLGFEGEIVYNYKNKLNAIVNFSKFNSLNKQKVDKYGNPNRTYNMQLPNEPFFTVNGSLQYRMDNLIQRRSIINMYYTSGYVAPFQTIWIDTEGWFTTTTQFYHDIGASYRVPKGNLVISADFKNIFNAEVYDNFGVQKPGRGIYVKLNYMLNNFNVK